MITYNEFIKNIIRTRGQYSNEDAYMERHHIIPKCLGGTDDVDNLINLSLEEHYEAHKLLALENPEVNGLTYAWHMMSCCRGLKISPEEYKDAKVAYSKARTGRKLPEEVCKKISASHQGKPHEYLRKPVYCITLDKTFASIKEAGEYFNINKTNISLCCRGQRECAGEDGQGNKLVWMYRDDFDALSDEEQRKVTKSIYTNPRGTPVCCVELDKKFDSITDAIRETGIDNIGACCKGVRDTAGGYHWEYCNNTS